MNLKQYQTDTLSVLRRFLEEARIVGPAAAYETITSEPEQTARLGHYKQDYTPLDDLPGVPYVCLRLPTGGGKTILGTHAIAVVRDAWIEKDCPLVLWLVPSNIIRKQTVEAFGKTHHPYRQALDEAFSGLVRVFDIGDFTQIRPQDIRDRCCVVVGTIQTLRVSDTEGRKVYAHNEEMEPHFSALRVTAPGLERMDNGKVKFSFANLLHIHRPLMIVDEAHNAVTGLTREMQARVKAIETAVLALAAKQVKPISTGQVLPSGQVCRLWNRNACTYTRSRHAQVGSSCGAEHPAVSCTKTPHVGLFASGQSTASMANRRARYLDKPY